MSSPNCYNILGMTVPVILTIYGEITLLICRKEITIMAILDVKHVKKVYTTRFGGNRVEALHDVNFSVE